MGIFDDGFDAVEFVMNIEEAFGIRIPDKDAERMRTAGELYQYLVDRVKPLKPDRGVCPTAAAFYALRRRIRAESPEIRDIELRPDTPISLLLGGGDVRKEWRELGSRLGHRLPPLCFSSAISFTLFAMWMVVVVLGSIYFGNSLGGVYVGACLIFGVPIGVILLCLLGWWAQPRWAKTIPSEVGTLGQLAVFQYLEGMKSVPATDMSEQDIWMVVRHWLSRNSGVRVQDIRRETVFIELI